MPASTKEQIAEAALKRFKTSDVEIGEGVNVTVREMSASREKSLKETLWQRSADGKFLGFNADGTPSTDGKGRYKLVEGVNFCREWLLATMIPTDAIEGIMSDEVADSVRDEILIAAQLLNGYRSKEEIAKKL
jgi:hypothetical protein